MKLLVCEDNQHLRKSIVDYLKDEGFVVDQAVDGDEGIYKAQNWDYDALILDIMMPGLDGYELLKRLRAVDNPVPVLMLTARTALDDRLRGLDGGADDYIVKPFEMEELVARVRSAIRRSSGIPNPVLSAGPITLNTSSKHAYLSDRQIDLTAREYTLLEILLTKQDEVISRDYLYEKLFDEYDETMSNMLDVYIYKLRQKFGKEHIVTRRGMGYQLVG